MSLVFSSKQKIVFYFSVFLQIVPNYAQTCTQMNTGTGLSPKINGQNPKRYLELPPFLFSTTKGMPYTSNPGGANAVDYRVSVVNQSEVVQDIYLFLAPGSMVSGYGGDSAVILPARSVTQYTIAMKCHLPARNRVVIDIQGICSHAQCALISGDPISGSTNLAGTIEGYTNYAQNSTSSMRVDALVGFGIGIDQDRGAITAMISPWRGGYGNIGALISEYTPTGPVLFNGGRPF